MIANSFQSYSMASSGGDGGVGGSSSGGNDDRDGESKYQPQKDGARPGSQARLGKTAVHDQFRVPREIDGVQMVDSIPRPTTRLGDRALDLVMVGLVS